jgi:hypothetical protein
MCQSASLAATTTDFSRYSIILTRKPFGEPPAEIAGANTTPAAMSFTKSLKMVAITEDANGETKVGFVDIPANKNYYLNVGESEDGIELVDANYEAESALLRKGSEEQWINMAGEGSGGAQPGAGGSPGSISVPSFGSAAGRTRESSTQRVRRRESLRQTITEPPKLKDEELAKHLKDYQMELIRAGGEKGPPLPMELTREMDDQLVSEGVLAPQEQTQSGEAPATPTASEQ